MNQEKVGQNILRLRKKYKLSQSELANLLGVTNQAISKWENGRGIPDIEFLAKYINVGNFCIKREPKPKSNK